MSRDREEKAGPGKGASTSILASHPSKPVLRAIRNSPATSLSRRTRAQPVISIPFSQVAATIPGQQANCLPQCDPSQTTIHRDPRKVNKTEEFPLHDGVSDGSIRISAPSRTLQNTLATSISLNFFDAILFHPPPSLPPTPDIGRIWNLTSAKSSRHLTWLLQNSQGARQQTRTRRGMDATLPKERSLRIATSHQKIETSPDLGLSPRPPSPGGGSSGTRLSRANTRCWTASTDTTPSRLDIYTQMG
ncbi:hypothetical protein CCHR01_03104 [Colletotrichum chrysophilum]|uniref:Uncharacterized protein n=1 Tax=Colletotrichum chrysophilum TaxID=1836956 RepID=A0AAD9ENV8_9PEZI|nr:hypothetical protein CCHR01_03104 [Colletotrichum chrysophilum]